MDFVKNLYRYKRLRHIAVGRHLLHDIAFSVHGLLLFIILFLHQTTTYSRKSTGNQ